MCELLMVNRCKEKPRLNRGRRIIHGKNLLESNFLILVAPFMTRLCEATEDLRVKHKAVKTRQPIRDRLDLLVSALNRRDLGDVFGS